jgi:transcriptional regulator with XRE-family HTH domain
MSNLLETVGKNLKTIRTEKGLSQEKLAELTGIHRTYIGAVERGEKNISTKNIEKIAKALAIQPYKLLIGNDSKIH